MDKKIISMILNKDQQGLELLKSNYESLILYILNGLRLPTLDIEECRNDIYLQLWHHLDEFDGSKISLKNYIALITRRLGLNYVRKNKKLFNEIYYEQMDLFEHTKDPQSIDWNQVLKSCNLKEKELFYRHFYYFQSIEEIAKEQGKSYKSIESSLYRLKKKLKERLKKEGYYGT